MCHKSIIIDTLHITEASYESCEVDTYVPCSFYQSTKLVDFWLYSKCVSPGSLLQSQQLCFYLFVYVAMQDFIWTEIFMANELENYCFILQTLLSMWDWAFLVLYIYGWKLGNQHWQFIIATWLLTDGSKILLKLWVSLLCKT